MKTGIIILNYNSASETIECIKSIERYNTAPVKYIVVDNGSTNKDGIKDIKYFLQNDFNDRYIVIKEDQVVDALPYITFLISPVNSGYARGNNKALKLLFFDSEIKNILIINNDILFIEDIIPQLSNFIEKNSIAGIVSPILFKRNQVDIDYNCARKNHSQFEIWLTFTFWYKNIFGIRKMLENSRKYLINDITLLDKSFFEIELPSGSCMLTSKKIMHELGGFDPNTFLYYEENILYKKINKIGLKNYLLPNIKCIHLGAITTKKEKSVFIDQCSADSAKYYIENYSSLNWFLKKLMHFAFWSFDLKIFLKKMFSH